MNEALVRQNNMDMAKYFLNAKDQKKILDQIERDEQLQQTVKNNALDSSDDEEEEDFTEYDKQVLTISHYADRIHESSYNFDIDETGAEGINSANDKMVEQKILMKSLESDVIYYVEGAKYT